MPPHPTDTAHSFLLLQENRFAWTAAGELARPRPNLTHRVLFVYGPAGIGKTHLARHFILRQHNDHPQRQLAHTSGAEFAAGFAEASANGTIPQFSRRFRQADILICEDLHELAGRPRSQELLTNIVDKVLQNGGRVFWTSNRLPGAFDRFSSRLAGRCRGGVSTSLEMPGPASRERLLQHFALNRQFPFSAELIRLLAEALPVSPRELLAAVDQLETLARHARTPIDRPLIESFLRRQPTRDKPTPQAITRAVAAHFNVPAAALRSADRRREMILPRRCAMFLTRRLTGLPLRKIARYFGRDHYTTVVHGCRAINKQAAGDEKLLHDLRELLARFHADTGLLDEFPVD